MRAPKLTLAIAAIALGLGCLPASAYFSTYDSDMAPLDDWKVFGFDLTSVPGDVPSLMAFKASLDPRLQFAINNRCRDDIAIHPRRYSPKVRMFCWGH